MCKGVRAAQIPFVNSADSKLLDLVARRYGKLPSEILGLDPWAGFQLDTALAFKYDLEDKDFILNQIDQIISGFNMIAKVLGAKGVKPLPKRKPLEQKIKEEIEKNRDIIKSNDGVPTINQLLGVYGGKGVVLNK